MLKNNTFVGLELDEWKKKTSIYVKGLKKQSRVFPGGSVVDNPTANAGDMGSSPGPGRSHMPQSN